MRIPVAANVVYNGEHNYNIISIANINIRSIRHSVTKINIIPLYNKDGVRYPVFQFTAIPDYVELKQIEASMNVVDNIVYITIDIADKYKIKLKCDANDEILRISFEDTRCGILMESGLYIDIDDGKCYIQRNNITYKYDDEYKCWIYTDRPPHFDLLNITY